MENEILMDDAPKSNGTDFNEWEKSGEDISDDNENTVVERTGPTKEPLFSSDKKDKNKNSAAKAVSHAQSVIGNTNPNVRTGLSDDLNNTGTNVTYTESEK